MIEKAPIFNPFEDSIASMDLRKSLQMNGTLKNIQDDYLYWDKVKYKSKEVLPIDFWKAIKFDRYLKSTRLSFGKYDFTYLLTNYIQQTLHHFDLNIGGTLGSNIGIAETDKNKYVISSIVEEAISSSQMEGANTTRKKAKEMIQKELKPKNRSEQMIYNNYVTMKHIIAHKNDDLTPESLLDIHQLISHDTLDKDEEGVFRDNDDIHVINHINSEIVHTPPPKDELPELIEMLCNFFNHDDDKTFIHPIIKGIIIHFMIGWIHPFADGNGRTARTLFYWYMLKKGYWLTEYLSISRIIKDSKIQYEKAYLYTEIDDNDLGYFITYHIKTMEKAFEALKAYIALKQKEVVQAAKFVKIPSVNERMAQILKIFSEDSDRVMSIKEIENRFNISNFTARADLKTLVELGFLTIVQVNKIKQNYIKSDNFEAILEKYQVH
ncbi:Fic family protein [Arcicella aquatica]|uniref:Fic family protein n=1 Tax=Arcicella aquatica TaxID=217141 RepID=A0ABU5QV82_9BACT|nr:Fic family protein [Arcicella aquatica]MEA5261022.1 Fic family protein [Arcicella aquatica]